MRIYLVVLILVSFAGCVNDPTYLVSPTTLEAGSDNGSGGFTQAKGSLTLPIKLETAKEAAARMALATKLGVLVPYVKIGDIDIEVDYTIQNLDNVAATAMVELNGANEWFAYDPSVLKLFPPGTEDPPPVPGLQGDIPIPVPAMGQVEGTFREDQLLEAAVDCDMITRGHVSPFHAILTINKDATSFQPVSAYIVPTTPNAPPPVQNPVGPVVPREAFANLIRIDLVFKPLAHMVLSYTVRVRDQRGIVPSLGLNAPASQVTQFMPQVYMVQ
jgi:hypothetical protein